MTKHKNNSKKKMLFFVSFLLLFLFSFRFYTVNKNVPKKFHIMHIKKGKSARLENVEIRILEKNLGQIKHIDGGNKDDQYDYLPISIILEVKNKSNHSQNLAPLKELALASDFYQTQTQDLDFPAFTLAKKEKITLTLNYTIDSTYYNKHNLNLVVTPSILQSLNHQKVLKVWHQKKILGITLEL